MLTFELVLTLRSKFSVDDDELFWKLSCIAIERQAKLWKSPSSIEKILLNDIHYSTIDGLLLMKVKTSAKFFRERVNYFFFVL